MNDKDLFGTVEFSVSAGLVPWGDPGQYVHTIKGTAIVQQDLEDEDKAGEITLKLVSATEAMNRGERLHEVCDADSADLEAVYVTLFDDNGDTKEDLDIEPGWNNLLFIDDVKFAPEYEATALRVRLIETSIAMFCPEGLVVAVEEALQLTVEEWRRLGFKRIADSPFVLRDQLRVNPYQEPKQDHE